VKPYRPLLAIALVMTIPMATLMWFYPSTGDFRADNPFWNGLEAFNARFQVQIVDSYDRLPSTPSGTALIVIPYKPFVEIDLEALRNYVSQGGTLMVLDDYGYGNQILSYLGLEVRFTGKPLLDPLFNYRNEWLPRVSKFSDLLSPDERLNSIVLNHASALSNTSDVTVLAWSSRFSYLDLDGDSTYDTEEPMGPLPVAAYVKFGEGYVAAIADPSILINSMIEMDDNLRFMTSILNLRRLNLKVHFDQSHFPKTRLDEAKQALKQVHNAVSTPVGTLFLITVILISTSNPIWRRKVVKH